MRSLVAAAGLLVLAAALGSAQPRIDGHVEQGEYSGSASLVYGDVAVSWYFGAAGDLSLAVSAPTGGWVAIGIGSVVMDGAHIFMGELKNGSPLVSEQQGDGHTHHPVEEKWADASAVAAFGGRTTLELHVPAERVPRSAPRLGFIVAYADTTDLTSFHGDNHDGGYIDLPKGP